MRALFNSILYTRFENVIRWEIGITIEIEGTHARGFAARKALSGSEVRQSGDLALLQEKSDGLDLLFPGRYYVLQK